MIKKADYFVIFFFILLSLLLLLIFFFLRYNIGEEVLVEVNGSYYNTYSLLQNQTIVIQTQRGRNVIEIENGQAFMKESSCKDLICVNQGSISHNHQHIVCLPNRVVVTINNNKPIEVDAVVE